MTPLVWAAVLLAAGARAGNLVRVDFVGGAVVRPSPIVQAWSPALAAVFAPGVPRSDWPDVLRGISSSDFADPRNGALFEPFARELARESAGLTPEQLAAVPAPQRAAAAARAARAAVEAQSRGVREAMDATAGALGRGPEAALAAAVEMLRREAAAGPWLSRSEAGRVESLHRAAVALQADARAARALERLRRDSAAFAAADPLEAALARDPGAPASDEKRRAARLVKFDPSRRKAPEAPKIALRPGQNPGAVIQGLSLGLSPAEAAKLGFEKPAEDLVGRYASALGAARLQARSAGLAAESVYFGAAQTPLGSEDWTFTFYVLSAPNAARGLKVDIAFAEGPGVRPFPVSGRPAAAHVPAGVMPAVLSPSSLPLGVKFSLAEARRFSGAAVPPAQVGLYAVAQLGEVPETGERDLWYRFVDGAGREYARFNARTGEAAAPPAPKSEARESGWARVRAWLKSLL